MNNKSTLDKVNILPLRYTPVGPLSSYVQPFEWVPYDSNTRTGRFEFIRDLMDASRNNGKVALYYDWVEGIECAIKIVPIKSVEESLLAQDTENALVDNGTSYYLSRVCDCKYVAKWYGCFASAENYYFVNEYGRNGDLFPFLSVEKSLDEPRLKQHLFELLLAIDDMHTVGVAHLDISVENVILRQDNSLCLVDFGMARSLLHASGDRLPRLMTRRRGKLRYQPPECHPSNATLMNNAAWKRGMLGIRKTIRAMEAEMDAQRRESLKMGGDGGNEKFISPSFDEDSIRDIQQEVLKTTSQTIYSLSHPSPSSYEQELLDDGDDEFIRDEYIEDKMFSELQKQQQQQQNQEIINNSEVNGSFRVDIISIQEPRINDNHSNEVCNDDGSIDNEDLQITISSKPSSTINQQQQNHLNVVLPHQNSLLKHASSPDFRQNISSSSPSSSSLNPQLNHKLFNNNNNINKIDNIHKKKSQPISFFSSLLPFPAHFPLFQFYPSPCDIFSVAVVILSLILAPRGRFSGSLPWTRADVSSCPTFALFVVLGLKSFVRRIWALDENEVSDEILEILERMLIPNYKLRPCARELLKCPYFESSWVEFYFKPGSVPTEVLNSQFNQKNKKQLSTTESKSDLSETENEESGVTLDWYSAVKYGQDSFFHRERNGTFNLLSDLVDPSILFLNNEALNKNRSIFFNNLNSNNKIIENINSNNPLTSHSHIMTYNHQHLINHIQQCRLIALDQQKQQVKQQQMNTEILNEHEEHHRHNENNIHQEITKSIDDVVNCKENQITLRVVAEEPHQQIDITSSTNTFQEHPSTSSLRHVHENQNKTSNEPQNKTNNKSSNKSSYGNLPINQIQNGQPQKEDSLVNSNRIILLKSDDDDIDVDSLHSSMSPQSKSSCHRGSTLIRFFKSIIPKRKSKSTKTTNTTKQNSSNNLRVISSSTVAPVSLINQQNSNGQSTMRSQFSSDNPAASNIDD